MRFELEIDGVVSSSIDLKDVTEDKAMDLFLEVSRFIRSRVNKEEKENIIEVKGLESLPTRLIFFECDKCKRFQLIVGRVGQDAVCRCCSEVNTLNGEMYRASYTCGECNTYSSMFTRGMIQTPVKCKSCQCIVNLEYESKLEEGEN